MAQIKDLAVGEGYVCLMENGVKTRFYVLAHDYESGLNGTGRALVVRESPVTSGQWSDGSSTRNCCGWGENKNNIKCVLYNYLNNDYLNLFSADSRKWMAATRYYAYHGTGDWDSRGENSAVSSAVFTVSAAESLVNPPKEYSIATGHYESVVEDGSLLSYDARKRLEQIFTAYGYGIWTRTLGLSRTYDHKDSDGDRDYFYYHGILLSGVSDSEWGNFSYTDASSLAGASYGYLPCFTLPETLYVTSDGFATENQPPELTGTAGKSGTDLGEKNVPFALSYTVTDNDGDTMTVTEKLDGVEKAVHTGVASGTALSVAWLNEKDSFQQITNGSHTLTIAVNDTKTTTEWKVTFTKITTEAAISMTAPMTADAAITVAAMTLEGTFPADTILTVEMTNNGLDDEPVWEQCTDVQTSEVKAFMHHTFANTTAAKGYAFNYRVQVSRSANGTGGNITMLGGTFA